MFEFLSVLWFFLIFILIAGYFVLDGFDLGIGVLSPFIAKNGEERAILRRAIGPVWDGNEVWVTLALFVLVYAVLLVGWARVIGRFIKEGPVVEGEGVLDRQLGDDAPAGEVVEEAVAVVEVADAKGGE